MDYLKQLKLLQLSDSALPIGNTAHSFGLETLVNDGYIEVDSLLIFFQNYISENGLLESFFCRSAYGLAMAFEQDNQVENFLENWHKLNSQLSAFKTGREGREASATLGRRFFQLALNLEQLPILQLVGQATTRKIAHHCIAFGLVGSAFAFEQEATVLAYLHQSLAGLISACQRLLPLGQSQASWLLWQLKPDLMAVAERSAASELSLETLSCFMPLLELAVMRHPGLTTRLFIS